MIKFLQNGILKTVFKFYIHIELKASSDSYNLGILRGKEVPEWCMIFVITKLYFADHIIRHIFLKIGFFQHLVMYAYIHAFTNDTLHYVTFFSLTYDNISLEKTWDIQRNIG